MGEINKAGIPVEIISRLKNYDESGNGIFEPKEIANMPEGEAAILIYYFIADSPSEEKQSRLNTTFVILNQLPVEKIAGIFSASRIDEIATDLFAKLVAEKPDMAHAVALKMVHLEGGGYSSLIALLKHMPENLKETFINKLCASDRNLSGMREQFFPKKIEYTAPDVSAQQSTTKKEENTTAETSTKIKTEEKDAETSEARLTRRLNSIIGENKTQKTLQLIKEYKNLAQETASYIKKASLKEYKNADRDEKVKEAIKSAKSPYILKSNGQRGADPCPDCDNNYFGQNMVSSFGSEKLIIPEIGGESLDLYSLDFHRLVNHNVPPPLPYHLDKLENSKSEPKMSPEKIKNDISILEKEIKNLKKALNYFKQNKI